MTQQQLQERRSAEREAKTYNDHLNHTVHMRAVWNGKSLDKELDAARKHRKVVQLVDGHYTAVVRGK